MKGSTLGDAEDDVDDTLKWIKRSKKKEKALVKKRQEELEHMDKVFQGGDYTESMSIALFSPFTVLTCTCSEDLEGLKVSHDFEGMEEGEARILTLKDSRILDNEGEYMHDPQLLKTVLIVSSQRMNCRMSKWLSVKERRRTRTSRSNDATIPDMMMRSLLPVRLA